MRMTEEGDFGGRVQETIESLRWRKHIFVFILKRAMNQHDAVRCQWTRWQRGEPGGVIRLELRARPTHAGFPKGVEVGHFHHAGDALIGVSAMVCGPRRA